MSTDSPDKKRLPKQRRRRGSVQVSLQKRKALLTKISLKQRHRGVQISFSRRNNYQNATVTFGDIVAGDKITDSNVIVGSTIKGDVHQTIVAADESYQVNGDSPYLGLAAYPREASQLYAGRENRVAETIKILTEAGAQPSLLFVVGASGSGKSSFVQAGVLPALEQAYTNYHVRSTVITPSVYPRSKIQRDIVQTWSITPQSDWTVARCFQEIATHTAPSTINLIVIDQFEEVWTQSDPEQSRELLEALKTLPPFSQSRTQIIVTVRADFVYKLYQHKMLYDLATKPPVVELRPMSSDDIRRAIEQPLRTRHPGKRWEPLLLKDLARVAADQIDALPLLQVMLDQQWQTGKLWLDAPKNFDRAISDHADAIYNQYLPNQQMQIMQLLIDLVKVGDEPRQDVRQRRSITALCDGNAECEQLVSDLIKARLLSSDHETRNQQSVPVVTIIHESLLMNWPLLRENIKKERDTLSYRKRLEDLFNDWQKAGQSQEHLLRDAYLAQAAQLVDRNDSIFRDKPGLFLFYTISAEKAEQDLAQQLAQAQSLLEEQRQRADAEQKRADAEKQGRLVERRAKWRLRLGLVMLLVVIVLLAYQPISDWRKHSLAVKLSTQNTISGSQAPVLFTDSTGKKQSIITSVAAFKIDSHLVLNQQYCLCNQVGTCTSAPIYPQGKSVCDATIANDSATNLTMTQANQYCQWIDRRLPTELEWEWAVRTQPEVFKDDPTPIQVWTVSSAVDYDLPHYSSTYWPNTIPTNQGVVRVIARRQLESNGGLSTDTYPRYPADAYSSFSYIGFRCAEGFPLTDIFPLK